MLKSLSGEPQLPFPNRHVEHSIIRYGVTTIRNVVHLPIWVSCTWSTENAVIRVLKENSK